MQMHDILMLVNVTKESIYNICLLRYILRVSYLSVDTYIFGIYKLPR